LQGKVVDHFALPLGRVRFCLSSLAPDLEGV